MINFDTDRLIILWYPGGAGGKFLINALGLSNSAVLQDNELAIKQVRDLFTPADKLAHLRMQLDLVTTHWNDLNLGCEQFFNFSNDLYLKNQPIDINPNIEFVINNNLYFFIVAHDARYIREYLKRWPNAKVIIFKNVRDFILSRGNFRFTGIPEPTNQQINQSIINFDFEVKRFNNRNEPIWWDTNWFFSKDDTVSNIKQIYNIFGLNDFNEDYISTYYDLWINKLEQLKHK